MEPDTPEAPWWAPAADDLLPVRARQPAAPPPAPEPPAAEEPAATVEEVGTPGGLRLGEPPLDDDAGAVDEAMLDRLWRRLRTDQPEPEAPGAPDRPTVVSAAGPTEPEPVPIAAPLPVAAPVADVVPGVPRAPTAPGADDGGVWGRRRRRRPVPSAVAAPAPEGASAAVTGEAGLRTELAAVKASLAAIEETLARIAASSIVVQVEQPQPAAVAPVESSEARPDAPRVESPAPDLDPAPEAAADAPPAPVPSAFGGPAPALALPAATDAAPDTERSFWGHDLTPLDLDDLGAYE